ncbi:MAG: tetratricopeptide repeat protein [Bryobacter sp.]|nr:tetratricopeptide repeat protein [Bryobacter sp.]
MRWLLLVFSTCLFAQPASLATKANQAKQFMAQGKFADAAKLYAELAKVLPSNGGLVLNHGLALHMSGQDKAAIPVLEKSLKLNPQQPPAMLFLGASYLRTGNPAKAIPYLEKFLPLDPRNLEARRMAVDAYEMTGQSAKALPHWEALADAEPKNPGVLYGLGRSWEAYAAASFAELDRRFPESAPFFALLGDTRSRANQRRVAYYLYREALKKDPAFPGLHAALAEIYRLEGQPQWALAAEAEAAKLPAPDCANLAAKPACQFAQGNFQSALAAARRQDSALGLYWRIKAANEIARLTFLRLEAAGPSPELYRFQAEELRQQGRAKDAVEAWRSARRLEPENPQWTRELAITLFEAKEYTEADKLCSALLAQASQDPQLLHLAGDIQLAQQLTDRAIPLLEKAAAADPKNLAARSSLARALMQAGRPADALPHATAALPLDQDGSLHFQLARAYQSAGLAEDAKRTMAIYQQIRARLRAQDQALEQEVQIAPLP